MSMDEINHNLLKCRLIDSGCYITWLINLEHFYCYIDVIKQCLSEDELIRACKVKVENKKNMFYLRKGLTRIILSGFMNCPPEALAFYHDKNGKPYLVPADLNPVHFNLSHSRNYIYIAVAFDCEIGVDVETVRPDCRYSLLESSMFSLTELSLFRSYSRPGQISSFFKAWVQKEAVSKALGLGISMGFDTFSVDIGPVSQENRYCIAIKEFNSKIEVSVLGGPDYYLSSAIIINERTMEAKDGCFSNSNPF